MSKLSGGRFVPLALALSTLLAGCANSGGLGDILGSVLGAGQQGQQGQQGQLTGTILGVDSQQQVIGVQQSNGQQLNLLYDANTRVVFENRNYPPTALERGDRITARVQAVQQGYYTDLVQVDQSVSGSSGTTSSATGQVQQMEGTVRQVDLNAGAFTVSLPGYGTVTVTMPYNASRTDVSRFQNLRSGQTVRFYGAFVNQSRVELRQFQ
jgi:hypothetical protein